MPNVVLVSFGAIPFVAQTWSIGAEEQFYLFWPILNKYVKNKLVLIISVFSVFFLAKTYFNIIYAQHGTGIFMYQLMKTIPIHLMAIGSFFAYLACYDSKFSEFLRMVFFSRVTQVLAFISLPLIIIFKIYIPYIQEEYFAFVFGLIIYNAALNSKNIFLFNNKVLSYLGKISYGLYMYHPIAIALSIIILLNFGLGNSKILVYMATLVLSIGISILSYEFFEKYFFKLKNKFKIV